MPKLIAVEVEQSLRRRIQAGEWSTAGRLPAERELAAHYGVARNTMRVAIRGLVRDGTLTREVGRGTFLASGSAPDFQSLTRSLAGASPLDVMTVRIMVEPEAAALAAARGTAAELDAVADAHAAAIHAVEPAQFEKWDAEIHQRIFAATRNAFLNDFHELLRLIHNQTLWIEIKRRSFSQDRRRRYCDEHEAIVRALLKRDSEAASSAMRIHLQSVGSNLNSSAAMASADVAILESSR
jgi:DNA-binding FadR family transcriptional regulator